MAEQTNNWSIEYRFQNNLLTVNITLNDGYVLTDGEKVTPELLISKYRIDPSSLAPDYTGCEILYIYDTIKTSGATNQSQSRYPRYEENEEGKPIILILKHPQDSNQEKKKHKKTQQNLSEIEPFTK